jgi:hypothetical protein
MPTTNGQSANFALGQPNLTSNTSNNGGLSASTMSSPSGVFYDGSHLLVADSTNLRILIWHELPTLNGQAADAVFGQPDFVSANNVSVSTTTTYYPSAIFSDGARFFLADSSRILVAPIP